MLAKLLLAITMAVSAILGSSAAPHAAQDGVSQVGAFYLHTDEHGVPTLWDETNGLPGLQVVPTHGAHGAMVPPDTRLNA